MTSRCSARSSGLRWCLFLILLLPAAAAAAPGLHLEPRYGPYTERFRQAGFPIAPDSPLLPMESKGPFEHRVTVDSTGAQYRHFASGFPEGATISMGIDDYLKLEYAHERRRIWGQRLRRQFRSSAVRQIQQRRFRWSVPFPESRTLRRIIGEEGPTLSLNGSRTISIGGKSEWTEGEVQTAAGRPSKFPSLSMKQESKFTVEGKVGELINIRINQDTQTLGSAFSSNVSDQLANQIKLDYKGDDDAIFQEVQAGNTTLELPSTKFVGFRQQNKGLFGIRAKGRLGPMKFTTIASHEKSKSNRRTFKGGAAVDTTLIRDWQYVRNTYFFLDEFYRANLPDFRKVIEGTRIRREDYVDPSTLNVYINDFNTNNDAETLAQPGVAQADLDDLSEESGWVERGTWHRLDPDDDYTLVSELGYIILDRPIQDRHALAVVYRMLDGRQKGSRAVGDTLRLKLIKARDARPEFPNWNLEWKNVYRIASGFSAGRKFDLNTLDVEIFKEIPGKEPEPSQSGKSYLQIFGLDERGKDPGSPADRLIDVDYFGLDDITGHLIFPDQTPFNPQDPKYSAALQDTIPEIYTSLQQRDLAEASRYIIQVRSSSTEQRISLGGILGGVQSETVEVRLNGKQLQRGSDYNVDYVGNVTFMGNVAQEVADPGADLEINYETEDIFGLGSQQKTLLGLRTEYEFWSGDGRVGSTMLYNNERTSERRVRVGSEPSRTIVWNLDLKAKRTSPLLTQIVDALPLLKTAEPSDITLDAEVAQSRPNLNTKKKGYIDDFEGSERPVSMGIGRTRWTPASLPTSLPASPDFGKENRERLIWYNPYDGVLRTDIWPGQEEQLDVSNKQTDVLTMELTYREDSAWSWGGIMSAFSSVNDFSQSKFLEIWARGEEGVLYIDLGVISEDVNGDRKVNTEDESYAGRSTGDGLVSKKEDIGIDGRDDQGELNYFLEEAGEDTTGLSLEQKKQLFLQSSPERDPDDPQGDNWHYDASRGKNDYSRINGTEGNKADRENGDLPDTEDLNNDGVLNTRNDYYHYAIDLTSDRYEVPNTQSNGWRQFRLPLFAEEVGRAGTPDSTRVEYTRLLFSSDPPPDGEPARVEIALIEVVGNDWREDDVAVLEDLYPVGEKEALNVTAVGTDKNPSYAPPPGVKIRRNVQSRTREREQSLVLVYEDLEPKHQVSATKVLSRTSNYTKYRRLRMYVHGDSSEVGYVRGDSSEIELFIRFGADSTNYYEFISPVFPGWEGGRSGWQGNEVDIDLLQISQLKSILQSGRTELAEGNPSYVVLDPKGAPVQERGMLTAEELAELHAQGFDPLIALDMEVVHPHRRDGQPAVYRVRGNPSMQQIKQLTIGLRNQAASQRYSGQVFVDELRLEDARNDVGVAAYARLNTQLADFMNIDASVDWREDDFRTVTGGGGTNTALTSGMQASTQLHKFLPGRWGFSIPVKVNLRQQVSLPRFGPNSDVELTRIEKDSLRTESAKELYDISFSRRAGKNWLLRWTLDQINLRLSHSRETRSGPVRPLDIKEAQTMSFSYRLPLPRPSLSPFFWMPGFIPGGLEKMEIRYLPANLSYSMGANRVKRETWQQVDADTTFQEDFRLNETYTAKATPITGVSGDYSLKVDRDLRKKFDPGQLSLGREVGRKQTADVSLSVRFIKWLDQTYTFKANYEENNDPAKRRTQAVIDSTTGSPIKTRDINTRNDLSARFNLKVPALLKSVGQPGKPGKKPSGKPATRNSGEEPGQEQAEGEASEPEPKAQEKVEPGKPFFLWRVLHFTGGFVEPVTATWRRNTTGRNFNLIRRPPLIYQLGLDDSLKVARSGVGLTQQDAWSRTATMEMGSGMRLPLGLSLKANYNEKLERRSGSTQTRLRVRKEQRFPRLNVSWGRADRLPYIKKVINSAQVNAQFEEVRHSEGEGSLGPRNLLTRGKSREIRISWNGRWRFGPTTSIERVFSLGTDLDFEVASEEDSTFAALPLRGSSSQEKTTTTFGIKHNLKPRSLPLFGKLKSNVDLKFEFSVESEIRANATGEAARAPITNNDKWRTSLTISYKFSENFRGEGLIRIENNDNKLTEKTRKIREVKLAGTFFLR